MLSSRLARACVRGLHRPLTQTQNGVRMMSDVVESKKSVEPKYSAADCKAMSDEEFFEILHKEPNELPKEYLEANTGKPLSNWEEHLEIEEQNDEFRQHVGMENTGVVPKFLRVGRHPDHVDIHPEDLTEYQLLDPLPDYQFRREVLITKILPDPTSAKNNTNTWFLSFSSAQNWANPLMGWASTSDPYARDCIPFESAEIAIKWAKQRSYNYRVEDYEGIPRDADDLYKGLPKGHQSYDDNFLPAELVQHIKVVSPLRSKSVFMNHTDKKSGYHKPLSFLGDGDCVAHGGDRDYTKNLENVEGTASNEVSDRLTDTKLYNDATSAVPL